MVIEGVWHRRWIGRLFSKYAREISDAVGYEVRSVLTTPIVCDGEPLGAIQVINKKTGSEFSGDEVEVARQLGRYAGGLIGLGLEVHELIHIADEHLTEKPESSEAAEGREGESGESAEVPESKEAEE